jgi:DNA-binding transcriptional LysR family regulator
MGYYFAICINGEWVEDVMEIQDVQVFLTVAEELHFGRAAERLHLTQPPVSRSVNRPLEKSLV